MRIHFLTCTTLPLLAVLAARTPVTAQARTVDIAIATFTVEADSAGMLRAAADSCLNRLLRGLGVKGIVATRNPRLTEKTLRNALPVAWAMVGHMKRTKGEVSIEMRLLEVATGDEMVSYYNSGKDAQAVANVGVAAAPRVAVFIQERKASKSSRQ
ncbi:MAG: hypothetical protein ACREMA_05790 [Longimicrobiales bacterium]